MKKRRNYLAICLLLAFVSLILCLFDVVTIKSYIRVKCQQDAIDSGTIVEATLTTFRQGSGRNTANYYHVYYEFYDVNGVQYHGAGLIGVTKDEAEAALGHTVNIYIDGKGHSIVVGESANSIGILVLSVVIAALIIVGAVVAILIYFRNVKYSELKARGV
jgi:hypothetical protein